jgi:cell volume regulation protein A
MAGTIIIALCSILLIAYLFDVSASKTKIPSVILLLLLGLGLKFMLRFAGITLPDFAPVLPVLGTIGLILIVLEGSLELELNAWKKKVILQSVLGALFGIFSIALLSAFVIIQYEPCGFKAALTNVLPFSIISSAIAIPTVKSLSGKTKEFVIYESSLSDIFGVILFNFVALNEVIHADSFLEFGLQLLIMLALSFLATIVLSFLLNKITHHIKFVPIIILIVLIYTIAKQFHLPALLFILIFGLFIGNLNELKKYRWIDRFKPERLSREVVKFKELNIEFAFLIRALFFILFGYLIEVNEVLNLDTLGWAAAIVLSIVVFRFVQLKLSGLSVFPLLFVAPRGLITILLFLSIDDSDRIASVNNSLITQIILISAFVMMLGMMFFSGKKEPIH